MGDSLTIEAAIATRMRDASRSRKRTKVFYLLLLASFLLRFLTVPVAWRIFPGLYRFPILSGDNSLQRSLCLPIRKRGHIKILWRIFQKPAQF